MLIGNCFNAWFYPETVRVFGFMMLGPVLNLRWRGRIDSRWVTGETLEASGGLRWSKAATPHKPIAGMLGVETEC